MKVLWFEVTVPSRYEEKKNVLGGWQDSLESIVQKMPEIELTVVFEATSKHKIKTIDGITYIPIPTKDKCGFLSRQKDKFTFEYSQKRIIDESLNVIEKVKPDIIHVFGMEWAWGSVSKYIKIPCVVHIMGSMVPYYNALFPPKYNELDVYKMLFPNVKKIFDYWCFLKKQQSWRNLEIERWKQIFYYMGRTSWDYSLVDVLHHNAKYYHVDEALRPCFLSTSKKWSYRTSKIRLVSTGCSTFWKGPDMILKVAYILEGMNIDFEWNIAGNMPDFIKNIVEKKEGINFKECGVNFIGIIQPQSLIDLLCDSSVYVHTAYIENSPNSICEAQILGIPIVSTNVGGISTIVEDAALLVPANDPWQMASSILKMVKDRSFANSCSAKGIEMARRRHNPLSISKQLLNCYKSILEQ